jgi:SAM-dependent methyltransferase
MSGESSATPKSAVNVRQYPIYAGEYLTLMNPVNDQPSSEVTIFETKALRDERMFDQLDKGRVDAGQYYAGHSEEEAKEMAAAWEKLNTIHPMSRIECDPINLEGRVVVADLGSGSGHSFAQATEAFRDRIEDVLLVDTLRPELDIAGKNIWQSANLSSRKVVANFLEDACKVVELMDTAYQRIVLCLGGNVGNYDQAQMFQGLKKYLRDQDQLWVGVGYLPQDEDEARKQLEDAAQFYESSENLKAALLWLQRCGGDPSRGKVWSTIDSEMGAGIVRLFYEFAEETSLKVNGREKTFASGDIVQFVESRRYDKDLLPDILKKRYQLDTIHIDDLGNHGIVHVVKV